MGLPKPDLTAGFCICAAAGILMLPLNWLIGWTVAVTVHEAAHMLVLKCCSIPIYRIEIGALGARISSGPMAAKQELLCAAAGPVFSFLLVGLTDWLPSAALIGLLQGLFNLTPVYPFDGGRIIRAAVLILRERRRM